jgi:glycosyltransferase involved in cell wall biosynthesis
MSNVDVVVPCYGYGCYLRGCVESVLKQEGVDVRVLIIDDCSPDQTPEAAGELMRKDGRVEYRRHQVNRGHIHTYNEGLLEWVTADYSMLLSADDLLAPSALRRAVQLLDRNPQVGMVYGEWCVFTGEHVPDVGDEGPFVSDIILGVDYLRLSCETGINLIGCPATVVTRTNLQKKIGGYRADLPHSADMEMWLRFAAHGAIGKVKAIQAYYRRHGSNMSLSYYDARTKEAHRGVRDIRQRKAAFDCLLREYGVTVPTAGQLASLAHAQLAIEALGLAREAFDAGNAPLCRDYMEFAKSADPGIRFGEAWSRLQVKCIFGPRLWSVVSTLTGPLRRRFLCAR